MSQFQSLDELSALVGQSVASSDWVSITQDQVDLFAAATGDQQWIHVDPERARSGPFGGTIAHGFLTLALLPRFLEQAVGSLNVGMGVNYGLNRVRFTAPVPVGSRLRAHFKLLKSELLGGSAVQLIWAISIEREGSDKPVCLAESLVRYYR
jgi:acyl dehydratase